MKKRFYMITCLYPYSNKLDKKIEVWKIYLGIFSSLKKAHKVLNKWPKEYSYTITEWIRNKDYKKSIECGFTSEDHHHYGVDYSTDFKTEDAIDFHIAWPSKPGSYDTIYRDLDPKKDKKLIKKYRKYMKNTKQKFCKFN
jgi:hypothetical protein